MLVKCILPIIVKLVTFRFLVIHIGLFDLLTREKSFLEG